MCCFKLASVTKHLPHIPHWLQLPELPEIPDPGECVSGILTGEPVGDPVPGEITAWCCLNGETDRETGREHTKSIFFGTPEKISNYVTFKTDRVILTYSHLLYSFFCE